MSSQNSKIKLLITTFDSARWKLVPWQTGKVSFHPLSVQSNEGEPIKLKSGSQVGIASAPLCVIRTWPCNTRPNDEQLVPAK